MLNKIFKKLASLKLAIGLFISLALIIVLATCLPQEPLIGRTALIEKVGQENYELLRFLGLNDVFHSYWYFALLFLLGLNLCSVSFLRVFPRARKAFYWPNFLKQSHSLNCEFCAFLQTNQWEPILAFCKKNYWQIKIDNSGNSAVLRKGAFHRLAASVTHIGILTTMLGALISLLFGFNGIIQGIPNERFIISNQANSARSSAGVQTSKIFHAPFWLGFSPEFEVKLGKTERLNYQDESPKQWKTNLKFFSKHNKELAFGEVSVNHPISFKGIDFYQADWKRILRLKLNEQNFELDLDKLKNTNSEIAFSPLQKGLGLLFLLPANSSKLQLIAVKGQFEPQNIQKNLNLLALLSPNQQAQIGQIKLKFIGAFAQTGLQYKYSPGDGLMIIGMSILTCGVLMAFGSKRVIWLIKEKEKLFILGNTDRSKELFKEEFAQILKQF